MNSNLLLVVIYNLLIVIAASWLIVDQGWSPWWYAVTYFFLLDVDKAKGLKKEDGDEDNEGEEYER